MTGGFPRRLSSGHVLEIRWVPERTPGCGCIGLLETKACLIIIDGTHITRNYRWWTAAGARGSLKDDGLTFGTNANAGVCIHFREKVPSPLSRNGHFALTVTVDDLEGLTEVLTRP
jgi:hypothetical protein